MLFLVFFFFFKQKTAYEMRISDWSSDVCSSDLRSHRAEVEAGKAAQVDRRCDGARNQAGACDQALPAVVELAHDQAGIVEGRETNTDREIEPLGDHVDRPVAAPEVRSGGRHAGKEGVRWRRSRRLPDQQKK